MNTDVDSDDNDDTRNLIPSSIHMEEEEGKPLPRKLKYLTAGVIFSGNIAYVSYYHITQKYCKQINIHMNSIMF